MRLILIRHGQTQGNVDLRLSGWTDDPLNEVGLGQALAIARHLATEGSIDFVYASPLQRARHTADAVAAALGGLPIAERPTLRERHFGIFEGLPLAHIRETYPDMALAWAERGATDWGPPDGEMPHEFVERIMAELNSIVVAHPDQRVLVVTHGGVIAVALAAWLNDDPSRWREYFVNNCSVTELEFSSAPQMVRFNFCVGA
jgi:2,3-bisphosphoglycerate-dependent phosphoglycerate mutase